MYIPSVRQRLLALVAVSVFLSTNGVASAQWQYRATQEFIIAYTTPDASTTTETLRMLQLAYARLKPVFGDSLKGPVVVFICADRSTFNALSKHAAPDWGDGLADPAHRRILLLSPRATPLRRPLDHVVAHELIHLLMFDIAGGRLIPTWFAEGAAIYYAGEVQHSDPILISRAILTNSLIGFDELDEVLNFEAARANLAYQQSYQAVRFLIQRHGAGSVPQLCAALALAPGPAVAFQESFLEDLIDFETAYFDWLRKNYRWQFLLDSSMMTWAAIVFLLFLAFLMVRWRTRRKIAEWEKEDGILEEGGKRAGESSRDAAG